MTPPKVPEGRPYTSEELLHTLYADAYTAAEDLFRVLRESRIGNQEISLFTFEENLSNAQIPQVISESIFGKPSKILVNYTEDNGHRPDLRFSIDYGDKKIHMGRLGSSNSKSPFTLTMQEGKVRNSYAPVPVSEVTQLITSLALKNDFLSRFPTARLRSLDIQDPEIADLLKAGLHDSASKTEHVSDYELDLHDKDGYWLRARQNTVTDPPSFTLAICQSQEDIEHFQSKVTTMEVTLRDTVPDASIPLLYEHKTEIHSPHSLTGAEYSFKQNVLLDNAVLSHLIAACDIGIKSLRGSMPDVVGYERYAEMQLDQDDPRQ
jgi:hypothetical protein